MKQRRVSGIKPTGKIHFGNYFGAIERHIREQTKFENIYFVADYHALTTLPKSSDLKKHSLDIVLDYLALGLDPNLSKIFLQSSIPEHTELCWILSNLAPYSLLQRAHAFKAHQDRGISLNVGLFTYPILMAADILMYDADLVPVGKDQKQHVEIARDLATKFNIEYGQSFKLPEPEIVDTNVPGTDGQKMSKSYDNTIQLFSDEADIKKSIFSIVTDSKGLNDPKDPDSCNIFSIYSMFLDENSTQILRDRYKGALGYGNLKKELFNTVLSFLEPFREKRAELEKDMSYAEDVLAESTKYVRAMAENKMESIRDVVGLNKKR